MSQFIKGWAALTAGLAVFLTAGLITGSAAVWVTTGVAAAAAALGVLVAPANTPAAETARLAQLAAQLQAEEASVHPHAPSHR